MKQLRLAHNLVQRDIDRLTDGRINAQQVSRIEKADIEKPAMQDLVELGVLYGVTPNEIAEYYGYWRQPRVDPVITHFLEMAETLKPKYRDKLYNWLEVATTIVKQEQAQDEALSNAEHTG